MTEIDRPPSHDPASDGPVPARSSRPRAPGRGLALFVIAVLALTLFVSLNAIKLAVAGLPLRAILLPIAILATAVANPRLLADVLIEQRRILLVILLYMILAVIVSLLAHNPPDMILQQVVEIHLQALLAVIATGVSVHLSGPRPVMIALGIAFGFSGTVAFLQFLNIDIGWQARAYIGRITNDPKITQDFYTTRWRALGMAFNPVILGSQATIAFAGFFVYRIWVTGGAAIRRIDWSIFLVMLFCAAACIASGNRSPLLGFMIFTIFYIAFAAPKAAIIAAPLLIVAAAAAGGIMENLAALGLRVAQTGDSSSEGRATLALFGLTLFMDRPIGYGLAFSSIDFAGRYQQLVVHMPNPEVIRNFTLHNYFLLMLTKYGVGAILLLPLVLPRRKFVWWTVVGLTPYFGHVAFHNAGPLQGDVLIWFVLPLFFPAIAILAMQAPDTRRLAAGSWRRQYREMGGQEPA